MNSDITERQICAAEKKVINELGLLPNYADPYFMKVWNQLLADEMMLEELTAQTLESAAVKASLAMQLIAENRAETARCHNQQLRDALLPLIKNVGHAHADMCKAGMCNRCAMDKVMREAASRDTAPR